MSTFALLYREGPPLPGLDAPKHVPGVLAIGDHGLVPGLGLVHQAERLDVVREPEVDPKDVDISLPDQQLGVDVNVLTHKEVALSATFLRTPLSNSGPSDWDD